MRFTVNYEFSTMSRFSLAIVIAIQLRDSFPTSHFLILNFLLPSDSFSLGEFAAENLKRLGTT
jgi:hypothetical protein